MSAGERRPDEHPRDELEATPLDPREAALVEELVSDLPAAEPDPAFRRELRAAFTTGDLAPGAGDRTSSARSVVEAQRPPWSALWLVPLAAAAAVLLWAALNLGGGTRAWDAGPGGELLARALGAGEAFEAGAESADAITPSGLHVRVLPGTRLLAVAGDEPALHVERGEALIWLPQGYKGPELAVDTPDARLVVTGTALSVMVNDELTCVCVEHGTVRLVGGQAIEAHTSWRALRVGGTARCDAWLTPGTPGAEEEHAHQEPLLAFVSERAGV